jgi:general secretion pathway protein A
MYHQSYKLRRGPFEISPDPTFLFRTRKHYEALATLYYGVRHQKGFVVLTGEVGTGKTLLVRCLLHLFKGNDFACAYVFNSRLSPRERTRPRSCWNWAAICSAVTRRIC